MELARQDHRRADTASRFLPVVAAWKVFSAFGVEPDKVFSAMRGRREGAPLAPSIREQFAEEFGEVTRALHPKALTIFVDDIDRCRPDQVFAMLEAINFLASSGECYVVLGMEQQVVLSTLEKKLNEDDLPKPDESRGLSRPQLWLEKLVQLQLRVSKIPAAELRSIFNTTDRAGTDAPDRTTFPQPSKRRRGTGAWQFGGLLVALLLIGLVGYGAYEAGDVLAGHLRRETRSKTPEWLTNVQLSGKVNNADVRLRLEAEPSALPAASTLAESPPKPTPTPGISPPPLTPTPIPQRAPVSVSRGGVSPFDPVGWLAAAAALIGVAVAAQHLLHKYEQKVHGDLPTFIATLNGMAPMIELACATPRAVKQLINRLRLYAMLLRHWGPQSNGADTNAHLGSQEANLIVFGILEKYAPSKLAEVLRHPLTPSIQLDTGGQSPLLSQFSQSANEAVCSLSAAEFKDDFQRLLDAIEITP